MAIRKFELEPTTKTRALQIYLILIGAAKRRETLTYGIVADWIGYSGAGVLDRQLGHIMNWCEENRLPPLTILVVNSKTGQPGVGLVTPEDFHADRERVFGYNWYGIFPPEVDEFPD
jgi:alkylated DNA nucleotide flippase Atl1